MALLGPMLGISSPILAYSWNVAFLGFELGLFQEDNLIEHRIETVGLLGLYLCTMGLEVRLWILTCSP